MTAEIVIMNKQGVAIAADSAVTISNESKTKKIYNSANKVFMLSSHYPIGIMVYGGAEFMTTPWETIIKIYRTNHLKNTCFATVEEHFDHFIQFLTDTSLFTEDEEKRYVISQVSQLLMKTSEHIHDELRSKIKSENRNLTQDEISEITNFAVRKFIVDGEKINRTTDFSQKIYDDLLLRHRAHCLSNFDKILDGSLIPDSVKNRYVENCILRLGLEQPNPICTGLVIVGYGDAEKYPSLVDCILEGRVFGHIYLKHRNKTTITNQDTARIRPFAQIQMVDLFVNGIHSSVQKALYGISERAFSQIPDKVIEQLTVAPNPEDTDKIKSEISALLGSIKKSHLDYLRTERYLPLLRSIAMLPKEELVTMAKTLINLTSFERRVTHTEETVGGPIDLAVISKGDGFVWIERKHYFDKELNHDFFKRRYDARG